MGQGWEAGSLGEDQGLPEPRSPQRGLIHIPCSLRSCLPLGWGPERPGRAMLWDPAQPCVVPGCPRTWSRQGREGDNRPTAKILSLTKCWPGIPKQSLSLGPTLASRVLPCRVQFWQEFCCRFGQITLGPRYLVRL